MATTKDSGEISTEELRAKAKELHIRFTKSTSDDVLLEKIEEDSAKRLDKLIHKGRLILKQYTCYDGQHQSDHNLCCQRQFKFHSGQFQVKSTYRIMM